MQRFGPGFLAIAALGFSACTADVPPANPAGMLKDAAAPAPARRQADPEFTILGPMHDPALPDPMQGQLWRLKTAHDADGQRLRTLLTKPGMPISLVFADARVSVRNSCNHMSANYRTGDDGQISISALQQTEKTCPEAGAMAAEAELIRLLQASRSASVSSRPPLTLVLTTEHGETVQFDAVPLPSR
ncbi:MAG: META domain-containing protein [Pseudomonadota bacterium]|nr:META domain-containing protein [Pseudomonadota bacterium]